MAQPITWQNVGSSGATQAGVRLVETGGDQIRDAASGLNNLLEAERQQNIFNRNELVTGNNDAIANMVSQLNMNDWQKGPMSQEQLDAQYGAGNYDLGKYLSAYNNQDNVLFEQEKEADTMLQYGITKQEAPIVDKYNLAINDLTTSRDTDALIKQIKSDSSIGAGTRAKLIDGLTNKSKTFLGEENTQYAKRLQGSIEKRNVEANNYMRKRAAEEGIKLHNNATPNFDGLSPENRAHQERVWRSLQEEYALKAVSQEEAEAMYAEAETLYGVQPSEVKAMRDDYIKRDRLRDQLSEPAQAIAKQQEELIDIEFAPEIKRIQDEIAHGEEIYKIYAGKDVANASSEGLQTEIEDVISKRVKIAKGEKEDYDSASFRQLAEDINALQVEYVDNKGKTVFRPLTGKEKLAVAYNAELDYGGSIWDTTLKDDNKAVKDAKQTSGKTYQRAGYGSPVIPEGVTTTTPANKQTRAVDSAKLKRYMGQFKTNKRLTDHSAKLTDKRKELATLMKDVSTLKSNSIASLRLAENYNANNR